MKYPGIRVRLSGEEGNAFFIIGVVSKALRRAMLTDQEIQKFIEEAMSGGYGDYDHLLRTCTAWVQVA